MADVVPFGHRQPNQRTRRPATGKPKPKPIEPAPVPEPPDPADPRRLKLEKAHGGQLPPIEPEVVRPDPKALRPALDLENLPLRTNLAIHRRAASGQWVTGITEAEMASLNRRIYDKAMEASAKGNETAATQAARTLAAIKMAECREGELMDRISRLDDGTPTSITETPELTQRIARIIAAQRERQVVATVTGAESLPASDGKSPIDEIIRRAGTGEDPQ